jgi:UDP-N-acetylglucosamine 2-epimerase (non-hydrolysing)
MKIVTVLGTRPEIIRLSRVIPTLDNVCDHRVIHTGQNFDRNLNEVFFEDLGLRMPDFILECQAEGPMEQVGRILAQCEKILQKAKADRLLILGDTNSALSSIVAKRMGIPVYHMEAGNRCFDDRVPEEVNRRIVDHCSDVLMPYTERSRANLLREGIDSNRIFVTGNPILEVLNYYEEKINRSGILRKLGLKKRQFFLITLHRAENVDMPERLGNFWESFRALHETYGFPLVCSLHPRTRSQLQKQGKKPEQKGLILSEPFGLFDFVHLEKNAFCVLSDSGTVQEECCIFKVPNVTLRDVTERPETVECGSNILSGAGVGSIERGVRICTQAHPDWTPPVEYLETTVSRTVQKIVLGHRERHQ